MWGRRCGSGSWEVGSDGHARRRLDRRLRRGLWNDRHIALGSEGGGVYVASPCLVLVGARDVECADGLAVPVTAAGAFVSRAVPNPTTGGTTLRFAAPSGPVSVTVFDAAGRVVRLVP